MKVMAVFGTRPEAVKMCPLVLELQKHQEIETVVCLSGQHREMLDQVMHIFGVNAAYDLHIMRPQQTLTTITTDVLEGIGKVLRQEIPDLVLVHGDTSTSFAAALAAFYEKIPAGHVEAGLRTQDRYSPFPEEMNRCLTARLATLHFAPTEYNRQNLLKEKASGQIYVTGNTVIDAFRVTVRQDYIFKDQTLRGLRLGTQKCVLVTAHRRENLGQPLVNICKALRRLAHSYPDMSFIYPVHLNPAVQQTVHNILGGISNVFLIPPIDVADMHNLIARSYLVMTDSGGLQEEAPACGVPVLVLRTETERPEAAWAGTVKVTGVQEDVVFAEASRLIDSQEEYEKMAKAVNPYGDGHASERIVGHILEWGRACEKGKCI
ncbi:MAG: UDP-N-acetylglucosamine 2-epimerase (non-hydrolyzing) [Eubacterium sp.]|nr:UDP-N-acetylglucosamine 2-epimerase (non-hydrolyzing) [Eubacterium sp.]